MVAPPDTVLPQSTLNNWGDPLAKLMNTWKGKSARAANELLGRSGRFWQPDYFDTLIRNEAHLRQAVRYVEANPVKAGLVKEATAWPWSSTCPA